ncbi:MAG: TrkA family potassium uptake protein [Candidatus Altiarchaeota archaeon]
MKVLIIGGGTMGRHIALNLPEHDLTIIEMNSNKCHRIEQEIKAKVVEGDASKLYVLKKAGFKDNDAIIAVTSNDEVNLFLALLANKEGKQTVARVKEPEYIPLFNELGIKNIVSPEQRAAMDIAKKLTWS